MAIPVHLMSNREWGSMLYLFLEHDKLSLCLNSMYFDLQSETVNVAALKKVSVPWSRSEKFILKLALHCFNNLYEVDLGDMDHLDDNNKRLAFEALRKRYG